MIGDLEVLRALLRRRDEGSLPGARTDGHRIALVVSGGGMRGSYVGGMVATLEEAGLLHGFDEAYGTSAGAYVAAAFLTGQGWGAGSTFYDDLSGRHFIDLRRLGTRRPAVSLNYLLHHTMRVAKPFDWERLRDSPVPLRVIATGVDDLRPAALGGWRSVAEWKVAMRATANIPLLAGPPVELDGRRWVDGSVSEPVAVGRALREGATHVLALLARSTREVKAPTAGGRSPAWARSLNRVAPGLGAMARDVMHYHSSLSLVTDAAHPDRGDAHLLAITPARTSGVNGLTIDRNRLIAAANSGSAAVGTALRTVTG